MEPLLDDTLTFFLEIIVKELQREIDWRARGDNKNFIRRAIIYAAAFLRDLIRIPLHHGRGIGQAQYHFRVAFISAIAIPVLDFFHTKYPLQDRQHILLDEAIDFLRKGLDLSTDGAIPALDGWYATMDEFYQLTEYSHKAAGKIEEFMNFTG